MSLPNPIMRIKKEIDVASAIAGAQWILVVVLVALACVRYLSPAPVDPGLEVSLPDGLRGDRGVLFSNPEDTVIVFTDFLCPHCRRLAAELVTGGDTTRRAVVARMFPIRGATSVTAALIATCSDKQGAFRAVHDLMFSSDLPLSLDEVAEVVGLDLARLTDCVQVEPSEARQRLADDLELARQLGVVGTPAAFFDGKLVHGVEAVLAAVTS